MEFCMVLDFAWVDEYEPDAGSSWRVKRAIEEKNRKLRRKARRKYNETVRELAVVVKNMDERVIEMVARRRAEEEERKAREKAWREAEAKARAEEATTYKEQEWTQTADQTEEQGIDDGFDSVVVRRKQEEVLHCVVCSKKFKSLKQWIGHD